MKIAVTGKGGVGKTTFSALLCRAYYDSGYKVLAVDADPDANLAATLRFPGPDTITPISQMSELIEERTGAKPGSYGAMFKMNPTVDDLPEKLWVEHYGIRLMVMGGVKKGGGGCVCPESVLLKTLIQHLMLHRKDVIVMDMEAGIEHLGRATAKAVNAFITVVEPGRRSFETAFRIRELAEEIGISKVFAVGNRVRNEDEKDFIRRHLPDFQILGYLSYDERVVEADQKNYLLWEHCGNTYAEVKKIREQILDTGYLMLDS
ncbi:MAG: AAA family ATPase [Pseudomonadota bacterium]